MPLDPQVQTLLDQMAAMGGPPLEEMPVEQARQMIEMMSAMSGTGPEMASVTDHMIPTPDAEIPVRICVPTGDGPFPVLVWFHGGGFVIGNIATSDTTARQLADGAKVVVFNVDYRLAPEHPWPAPSTDCYAA